MFPFIQRETKDDNTFLMRIGGDLWDSRLYVIKASMCAGEEEKYKEEMQKNENK